MPAVRATLSEIYFYFMILIIHGADYDCGIQTPARDRQAGPKQAQPLHPLHLFPIFLLVSYPLSLPQCV